MSEATKITNARLREIIKEELAAKAGTKGPVKEASGHSKKCPACGDENTPNDKEPSGGKYEYDCSCGERYYGKALTEQVDHASMSAVVSSASKLLAAVESFKEKASAHAINAVTPGLAELEKTLEAMVSNPGTYVVKPKVEPKKVSLRAVKGDKVV